MDNDKRNPDGTFQPGNPGGPGRPSRPRERAYLDAVLGACNPHDWASVVQRAVTDAKGGDAAARQWLSRLLMGEVPASVPARARQAALEEMPLGERIVAMDGL